MTLNKKICIAYWQLHTFGCRSFEIRSTNHTKTNILTSTCEVFCDWWTVTLSLTYQKWLFECFLNSLNFCIPYKNYISAWLQIHTFCCLMYFSTSYLSFLWCSFCWSFYMIVCVLCLQSTTTLHYNTLPTTHKKMYFKSAINLNVSVRFCLCCVSKQQQQQQKMLWYFV